MVPGFNHEVTHHGRAYHVQTEDLGVANPLVVTQLFASGTVVATARTSYAELLGAEDLPVRVRDLMQQQHKQVLRNLIRGAYDGAPIDSAPAEPVPGPAGTESVSAGENPPPIPVLARRTARPPPVRSMAAPTGAEPPLIPTLARRTAARPSAVAPRAGARPPLLPSVAPRIGTESRPALDALASEPDTSLDQVILAYLAGETDRRE